MWDVTAFLQNKLDMDGAGEERRGLKRKISLTRYKCPRENDRQTDVLNNHMESRKLSLVLLVCDATSCQLHYKQHALRLDHVNMKRGAKKPAKNVWFMCFYCLCVRRCSLVAKVT